MVGNFRSVRTVRFVYHLLKISGLSCRARLDSSYHMKLHSERPTRITGLPFQNFLFSRVFSSGTSQKNVYHLHPNRNFLEFVVNGKQPRSTVVVSLAKSFLSIIFYHSDRLETQKPHCELQVFIASPCETFSPPLDGTTASILTIKES